MLPECEPGSASPVHIWASGGDSSLRGVLHHVAAGDALAGLKIELAIPRQRRRIRVTSVRSEYGPDIWDNVPRLRRLR